MAQPLSGPSRSTLVVVVDEDIAVRNSLKFLLELEGVAVATCSNATELMELPELTWADVIVMEHKPPKSDPFEAMRVMRLRRIDIPLILVAASVTGPLCEKAAKAGIRHVLAKPLLEGELVGAVRETIH